MVWCNLLVVNAILLGNNAIRHIGPEWHCRNYSYLVSYEFVSSIIKKEDLWLVPLEE